jgi:LmbE family N-acetylglucosaminyl deacetylase
MPVLRPRPSVATALACLALVAGAGAATDEPLPRAEALPPGLLLQELNALGQLGRVLYVAAHPDDENTRLLSTFARGRGYRTGYLSLTRGDGGQNLIGPELRDLLGVIRTQELLAARRIDGAIQYFSRANDFGFSKTPDETFLVWDRQQVLADTVRIIRKFRPHLIVNRFSTEPGITHGHHTASAILAQEAFALAGRADAFPEQIAEGLAPWQATRVLWNAWPAAFRGGPRRPGEAPPNTLTLTSEGYNPLLGESFGEIAARSRTQHKSQGFGTLASRGSLTEYFQVTAGEPAARDVFDGVDTSWTAYPEGEPIAAAMAEAAARFDPRQPAASVPALLDIRRRLATAHAARPDPALADKRRDTERLIAACLGLHLEAVAPRAEVIPGDAPELRLSALLRAAPPGLTVRWLSSRLPATGASVAPAVTLTPFREADQRLAAPIPPDALPTTPYWLRTTGTAGMFRVDTPGDIGRPENPPTVAVEHMLEIGGETITYADHAVEVIDDPVRGEIRRALVVVSPVSLRFVQDLELLAPGASRTVTVELNAARDRVDGEVSIEAPAGWSVSPASRAVALAGGGAKASASFTVTAPARPEIATLSAVARVGGRAFRSGRIDIAYDHIPRQLLQPPAEAKAVSVDVAVRARTVGYLPGAGDAVGEALARLGCTVTSLTSADLTPERLAAFDAVVLGIRTLNTRTDIDARMPALFAYAEAGGTVLVQYNTTNDLQTQRLAPYPLKLSRDRVTDETAKVTLLAPEHPALTSPNRLTAADFDGWVQERGLYFPNDWDERFVPLLACADPGEGPKRGSLLVARHGKGHFVYTGLSFFRQVPAGVPGAHRLLANLVSLGR